MYLVGKYSCCESFAQQHVYDKTNTKSGFWAKAEENKNSGEKKDASKTDTKASTNRIQVGWPLPLAKMPHQRRWRYTVRPTHSVSESEQCVPWGGNPGRRHSSSSLKKQVFQNGLQNLPWTPCMRRRDRSTSRPASHLLHLVGPRKSDTLQHVAFGHRHPCQPHPHSLGIWACRLGIMPRLKKPASLPSSERD